MMLTIGIWQIIIILILLIGVMGPLALMIYLIQKKRKDKNKN